MKNLRKLFIRTFLIGSALLVGIALLVIMVFDNLNLGRFDLTAEQVYKLSPSVEKILSRLEAPIEITYYVSSSEKMPTKWKNLERDVIDKLEELKLASKGRVTYKVFDPSAEEEREAFEERRAKEKEEKGEAAKPVQRKRIAERLAEKGVVPFGVQSAERDEFAVKRIYSSLVLSYLDRKEDVIEEVRPEMFGSLEYEIVSRIFKLIATKRPKVGFFPSQPEYPEQYRQFQQAPPDPYNMAVELLRNAGYDVVRTNITKDDTIPGGIQTMVLMVDEPLTERQLYEIDRLVHKGVRLVLAGQMYNYQIYPSRGGAPGSFDVQAMPTRININGLVKNYGFEIDSKIFMDRSAAFVQVPTYRTRRMGIFQIQEQRYEPVSKPVIIKVNQENINDRVSVANKITELFYMYGTKLNLFDEILKKDNLKATVLFTSSNHSWTTESLGYRPVDTSEPASGDFLRRQPLGVLIEGTFSSRYAEQPPPKWPSEGSGVDSSAAPLITGPGTPNKIIAYGCSNMFKDDVLRAVDSHKALLLNSVDALTLGDELIHIRAKNIEARRIKETSAFGKSLAKFFVVWFPALGFVALGVFLTMRRKMK
ncbi:MAG: GldG family protein [candidate division KSB1 bacterium]|nr:GldG family protein [candidate division KSB1 bacterium]MDZ7294011.1 GldG family protein [candidate division KSB1 bacterium]MDZ7392721.1 GldG family protein [candidate division KSB1 bacterium]MDZ7412083.1 GldG family protein [candidate division KSB1 bacterium]